MYVSVFEGSVEDGLTYDQEAFDIWKELIDVDRIISGNKKDNFWEMGAQGPCGPCSEIHVDIRSDEEKKRFIKKCVRVGKDNGMYGKTHSQKTIKSQKVKANGRYTLNWFIDRYGNIDGKLKYEERRNKLSKRDMEYCRDNKLTGVKRGSYSEEHKKKLYVYY